MINKVLLLGTVSRSPEQRHHNDKPVVTFAIETSRSWQDKVFREFHAIVVYGQSAITSAMAVKTGDLVLVEGSLQSRSWQDDSGAKRRLVEIATTSIQRVSQTSSTQQATAVSAAPV